MDDMGPSDTSRLRPMPERSIRLGARDDAGTGCSQRRIMSLWGDGSGQRHAACIAGLEHGGWRVSFAAGITSGRPMNVFGYVQDFARSHRDVGETSLRAGSGDPRLHGARVAEMLVCRRTLGRRRASVCQPVVRAASSSGGTARAMARSRGCVLDEPWGSSIVPSGADTKRVRAIFLRLGLTVLYVTTTGGEFSVADGTAPGRRRIGADGTPQELGPRPPSGFVARSWAFQRGAGEMIGGVATKPGDGALPDPRGPPRGDPSG